MDGMGLGRRAQWAIEEEQRIAEAEEAERRLTVDRNRRLDIATTAGYRYAKGSDPVLPPFDCPTCGAAVTLSGVERHIAWHEAR